MSPRFPYILVLRPPRDSLAQQKTSSRYSGNLLEIFGKPPRDVRKPPRDIRESSSRFVGSAENLSPASFCRCTRKRKRGRVINNNNNK